uniref:C-type lectin domain-containing protein n=1 Tax=Sparus aurata TaxID=8175 RepID=A0A671U7I1_SPAAU
MCFFTFSGAKVREGSFHVSHSAVAPIINELNYLRSNHSDVIEAEEEAKNALERAVKNHTQLKEKIEKQKTINDNYQKQVEELQKEQINLQSNLSALEGTCGRCLPGWVLHNSSCYYFSVIESSTIKKNWPDSRADCIRRGADLIVIDNKEEQRFVSDCDENTKSEYYMFGDGFWIGLTDRKSKGTWVWINNVTEVEQRYWVDQQMYLMYDESLYSDRINDYGEIDVEGSGEDCGVAVSSSSNPWKTRFHVSCKHEYRHWICEMTSS